LETQNNLTKFFFEHADAFMIAIGSDEVVTDINQRACEILGYQKTEVVGKNWFNNFVPQPKKAEAKRTFHEMLNGTLHHIHSEHPVLTKKGQEKELNFHNLIVTDQKGVTIGIISSAEDVTERKRKDKTSKEAENRLQASLNFMIEGYQIIDFDWRYIYLNEAAAKQGRKSKKELLGYTMMQAYPGIDKTELFNHLRNCMTNRVPHKMDNEFSFPDGRKGWFELHIEPVPEGILVLSMDITKNKEIEAELSNYRLRLEEVIAQRTSECVRGNKKLMMEIQEHKKTEEEFNLRAMILDNTREAIFLANVKGEFVYANKAATTFYGYSMDEFLNLKLTSLMQPKDAPSMETLITRLIEKGQTSLEMVHQRKDGTQLPVGVYSDMVKTMHGQFIILVIRRINYR
jgi:PAS domain S-box-containing protein